MAYPMDLGYDTDEAAADDICTLCMLTGLPDICQGCNLESEPSYEKRGHVFNPLLRGIYPKKSTYIPYNPLFRGSYHKKSPYNAGYHPFLRGGYGGPYPSQTNTNQQP